MNYAEMLKQIMSASGWSQEQLASKLQVTFATLNSWVNERSVPRAKAQQNIKNLHLSIRGADSVDAAYLNKVKDEALKSRIDVKALANNKELLDKLTLYLTYHTNTIEGSTMTLSDVEDVIFDNKVLSNRTAIEQTEARNHQATLHWLIDQLVREGTEFEITEEIILAIHLRLMHGIISDAGMYRNHAVRILGSRVTLANWLKIRVLMPELIANANVKTSDVIALIAQTHAAFEQIHPFSDGNGRTGRLIMLAQALKVGLVPPLVVKERKQAYYKYLETAQSKNNSEPLEMFVAESVQFGRSLLLDI